MAKVWALRYGVAASITLLAGLPPAMAGAQMAPTVLQGACDGSSATRLASGRFIVADDDRNVLLVYEAGKSAPVASVDLTGWLGTDRKKKPDVDGNPRFDETDIEASAVIGQRVYWIGSHGRAGDGDPDPARARFFATDIAPDLSVSPIGSPYRSLRDDLLTALGEPFLTAYRPDVGKNGPAPESDNGFNIEAMAATPNGTLLIGFRNPRPGGKALLVELKNPEAVAMSGAKALFSAPIALDLGTRGLRALEPRGDGYLLLGGPHGKPSGQADDFALYSWSGATTAAPVPLDRSIPAGFTPEAMVLDGEMLTLLSDDGDPEIDGKPCKEAPRANMRFRALSIPLPR